MTRSCTIPQIPLVIHFVMWQKGGLACGNVKCNHGYSLGAIIPCYADEKVFFPEKGPSFDPIRYQLGILTLAVRSAITMSLTSSA